MAKMQDIFKQILKETIAHLLKKHGFKKKGNNFARTFPGLSWRINVQSSNWNTSEGVALQLIWVYQSRAYMERTIRMSR